MSPQSIDRAQRPVVNRPRVSPTPRLISSGGPKSMVFLYASSAFAKASLLSSGCMVVVSKKAPSAVPLDWSRPPATEMIHQKLCWPFFLAMHEP
jgi:hypothetical protein